MTVSHLGLPTAPKLRGEIAEARFIAKALSLGFSVLKPFGDSQPFDFIVGFHHRLSRVQVKSCWEIDHGRYQFNCHRHRRAGLLPYAADDFDFAAAYIAPLDIWYIIPLARVLPRRRFAITTGPRSMFAPYREAWSLLTVIDGPPIA